MKIRVIKSFNGYKAGQVFEWGDGMARMLMARGLIESAEKTVEAAVVEVRAERADAAVHVKRRSK